MRARRIFFAVAGVLVVAELIILALGLRFRAGSAEAWTQPGKGSPTTPLENVQGWTIDSPQANERVPRRFPATGRCGPLPGGSHVILAVQTGRVLSPKIPPVEINGENWSGICNEFGVATGGAFSLCLFAVSDTALQELTEWHRNGLATGNFPPFHELPGSTLLAKANLHVAARSR